VEAWAPGESTLEAFLQDLFDSTGPDAVVWEVWPAFERWAPEVVLDWSSRFRDHFRTVQGSWLTNRRMGPRFWRNAVRNLMDWERPVRLVPGNKPIVIAASGPSLDDGIALLEQNRGRFDLWALPSSFETLVQRGLLPDAGIATDGGFYAREHLQRLAATRVAVMAALGSAPDPVLKNRPCLFFSQGLAIERDLLEAWGSPFLEVPSQGTVAVTALRLALEATSGPVFIAGLDLAFRDLRGHTSPHTVDRRFAALNHRLCPAEGQWADRLFAQATVVQNGVRTSPALVTYAGWFRSRAQFARPVYRIAASAVHWDSMTEVSWDQAPSLWKNQSGQQPSRWVEAPRVPADLRRQLLWEALNRMKARVSQAEENDPWLTTAARTAVPEALAAHFRATRRGGSEVARVRADFLAFLRELQEPLR